MTGNNVNLSFAGCGFLGIYHVGVAVCFKKFAPHLLLDKIAGASAGAIAACALLCDLPIDIDGDGSVFRGADDIRGPLGEMTSDVLRVVKEARNRTLGPFSPSFNIQRMLLEGLQKMLPEDAHLRVSGKLHISLTRVYDGKNVLVSQFTSKDDLMQALLASSFVPFFSGIMPPRFHGIRYMDGGFSDNLPTLDENTVTVSPFCGESDICPRDKSSQLFHVNLANTSIELSHENIYRFTRILMPPGPETLSNMCQQGFEDALWFLKRNNLISCIRCLTVQTTYAMAETMNLREDFESECQDCKNHQKEALIASLPDTVITIFQDAIKSANGGLFNWVFNHRGMKILSVLSLPYILPADIMYATFMKFVAAAPSIGNNLWNISRFLIQQMSLFLQKKEISASINCQLAITNFGGTTYDVEAVPDVPVALKRQMNVNFVLNVEREQKTVIKSVQSRRSSVGVSTNEQPLDPETFEHIMKVRSEHDAVMAFCYRDENNLMKVTEIYDVTDSESCGMLSPEERENNAYLQFDDEIEDPTFSSELTLNAGYDSYSNSMADISDLSLDDEHNDRHLVNVFSDPESEWNNQSSNTVSHHGNVPQVGEYSLPESDQQISETEKPLSRRPSFAVLAE